MLSDTVFPGLPEAEPSASTTFCPEHQEVAARAKSMTGERSSTVRVDIRTESAKYKSVNDGQKLTEKCRLIWRSPFGLIPAGPRLKRKAIFWYRRRLPTTA